MAPECLDHDLLACSGVASAAHRENTHTDIADQRDPHAVRRRMHCMGPEEFILSSLDLMVPEFLLFCLHAGHQVHTCHDTYLGQRAYQSSLSWCIAVCSAAMLYCCIVLYCCCVTFHMAHQHTQSGDTFRAKRMLRHTDSMPDGRKHAHTRTDSLSQSPVTHAYKSV